MTSQQRLPRFASASLSAVLLVAATLVGFTSTPVSAQSSSGRVIERLTATAVNMSGVGRATSGTLEIGIERWSTDAERDRLITILVEKGSDALMSALQDLPRVGYIRTPSSLGWTIHFARSDDTGDGRQVVFLTDRPMSFWELRNQPRSADYDFMLADIRFDAEGKGQGKLAVATKIRFNKQTRTIELENFGIEPVRLTVVRSNSSRQR